MMGKKKIIKIETAKHLGGHRLLLTFSDGKEQAVDFSLFLEQARHTEIRKFLNPKKFKSFSVENGELMWGDFDLIFPIMDLYENKLTHNEPANISPRPTSGQKNRKAV
jgi:hypothetical protein